MRMTPLVHPLIVLGLVGGAAAGGLQGCKDVADVCDLSCPDQGIADGNASISGVANVDAFFGAVISLREASANVNATMRVELERLAAALGVEGAAELSMGDLSAAVSAELEARIDTYTEGGLRITYQPPRCEASVEVVAKAAAECDVEVDPGEVKVECSGSCEVSAQAQAQCAAEGNLSCTGKAPDFACSGTCTGACEADVAFTCAGTCQGRCEGECSVCAGGDCEDDGNGVITNCAGACDGMCDGTCELEAGGKCDFRCEGSCEYDPGGVECEAGASAKCDVSASADIECEGKCEGEASPPEVSAECKAAVEAKASAEIECAPPTISIEFQFEAGLSVEQKAEFKALLELFKARFGAMLAANAKLERLSSAIVQVGAAAEGAVTGAVKTMAEGDLDLRASVGLSCALDELPAVETALSGAVADGAASGDAFASIVAAVGG